MRFISPVELIKKVLRILKRTARSLMARYFFGRMLRVKKDDEVYLLLGGSIGDNVYGLAYLDALHKKFPGKRFVVFSTPLNDNLLRSYQGIDEIRFPAEVHKNLCRLLHSNIGLSILWRYSELNLFIPIPCYYPDVRKSINKATLLNMRRIFNINDDSQITYHSLPNIPVSSIENFERIKHRLVIVNPYPHYRNEYRKDIYIPMCNELKSRGYIVYTNVIKEQKPVEGTEALRCSIEELYSIACDISLIVSGRGGILDFLIPSGINMFAIYESPFEYDCFPLSEWCSKGKIEEVTVNVSDSDSIKSLHEKFQSFLDELKQEGKLP